jgi:hypothetical protein
VLETLVLVSVESVLVLESLGVGVSRLSDCRLRRLMQTRQEALVLVTVVLGRLVKRLSS